MNVVNCAQCRGDISSEPFRYEGGDGRILCERCFYREEAVPEPLRAGFGFLRVMAYALKIAAVIGLVGGFVVAHSACGFNPIVSAAAIASGVCIFIVCIVAGELIRLGLSIQDGIARISNGMDRLPGLLKGWQGGPAATDVTRGDEERWGGIRGG